MGGGWPKIENMEVKIRKGYLDDMFKYIKIVSNYTFKYIKSKGTLFVLYTPGG